MKVSQLLDIREITSEGNLINAVTTGKTKHLFGGKKLHFSVLGLLLFGSLVSNKIKIPTEVFFLKIFIKLSHLWILWYLTSKVRFYYSVSVMKLRT